MSAAQNPLVKKMRLPAEGRALILNPPAGYLEWLGELPAGLQVETRSDLTPDLPADLYDFIQLFVRDRRELDQYGPTAWRAIKFDGLLWVCYPKQSARIPTDINRDSLTRLIEPAGLRPVMQIAIDAVWSGLRFRPAEAVGK